VAREVDGDGEPLYFYAIDRDFGPFFIKFCSCFPYNAKLCINGHEYLKRQLLQRGIAFEALDNGLLSCAKPQMAQRILNELSAEKIDALSGRCGMTEVSLPTSS